MNVPECRVVRAMAAGMRALRWALRSALGLPRVVVVELRWRLGDEIMALPLFESLRARYPADHLAVLTNYPDLFENQPFVDSVNAVPRGPDRWLMVRGASRVQRRIAAYAQAARVRVPVTRPHLYFHDWHTPLLAPLPPGDAPLIALAPGASWPTKRWPAEQWRALAQALVAEGYRIIELGSADEATGIAPTLAGKTGVRDAACILHACDLAIACDSGLLHLALAANTTAIGLFGPTDDAVLFEHEPKLFVVRSPRACAAPWNVPGPEPARGICPDGPPCCMAAITVEMVLNAVRRRIGTAA